MMKLVSRRLSRSQSPTQSQRIKNSNPDAAAEPNITANPEKKPEANKGYYFEGQPERNSITPSDAEDNGIDSIGPSDVAEKAPAKELRRSLREKKKTKYTASKDECSGTNNGDKSQDDEDSYPKSPSKKRNRDPNSSNADQNTRAKKQKKRSEGQQGTLGTLQSLRAMDMEDLKGLMAKMGLDIRTRSGPRVVPIGADRFSSGSERDETNQSERAIADEFPSSNMKFNDSLPESLPRGFQEPEPYNGSWRPSWALFALWPPSSWPLDRNHIQNISCSCA